MVLRTEAGQGEGQGEEARVTTGTAVDTSATAAKPVQNRTDADLFIGRVLSHYRLEDRLGAGGMGMVYRAIDLKLGRAVAIKLLTRQLANDEGAKARFLREARSASGLDHPNIGVIYEVGDHDGELFIAMALYEGETLKQRLEKGRLPLGEALDVLRQISLGLEAAHRAGIMHRDIKPANVMMTGAGSVKILDFGLAKLATDSAQTMTQVGQAMGTLPYMSPEQLRGEPVDPRTDLWSLGVVAHELLAGASPFQADSSAATAMRILNEDPPLLASVPGVPSWLAELVLRLLRKNPADRPQSATEVLGQLQQPGPSPPVSGSRVRKESQPAPRRWRWAAVGLAVCIAAAAFVYLRFFHGPADAIDSIAILPLANASNDPDTEYLGDGISESLSNSLSQLPNLKVKSRDSVARYKGQGIDAQKAGRELGVRAILTGRVLQRGDTISTNVQLVDVQGSNVIWGRQYNRKLADILALQEDLSREISQNLRLRLTGEEKQRLTKRHTDNAEAYQLYLRGLYYFYKSTAGATVKAREYFQQAIDKDPGYAQAYAGLAGTYVYISGVPRQELMPKAKAAARKALELDDSLAEAHVSMGWVSAWNDWDWAAGGKHFERAVVLNPASPMAHFEYGNYLGAVGRSDEALREMKSTLDLDPISPLFNSGLGEALYDARRFDAAIEQARKTLDVDPSFSRSRVDLGLAYAAKGMYQEAEAELEKLPERRRFALAYVYARAGKRTQALRLLDELKASSDQGLYSSSVALIYLGLGEKDQAFVWLEKAYEERSIYLAGTLKLNPLWDPLRSDPRYANLVRRIGLPP